MNIIESFRWYGPKDPVTLDDIKQAGAKGIVSALHDIQNGESWPLETIRLYKNQISAKNLEWLVVESVPVHENIKMQKGNYEHYINNYKLTLENLGKIGISTVCFNFMPVLDWTRTDISYTLEDGSKTLRFDIIDIAVFDQYILQRENSTISYSDSVNILAEDKFSRMSAKSIEELKNVILAGLPGSEETYTLETFRTMIDGYSLISHEQLRSNLIHFLSEIIPVAEKFSVKLAIHPDDPPFDIFGLPRIVSSKQDLEFIFERVPSNSNGFCFCSGSFGVTKKNDLLDIINTFSTRIHFLHLRSVRHEKQGSFHEANHLEGDTNLVEIMNAIIGNEGYAPDVLIPMRPDHGHQMLDDLNKDLNPGYSAIGRLKGLAELRGLEIGLRYR